MPYISEAARVACARANNVPVHGNAGELNYALTLTLLRWLRDSAQARGSLRPNYAEYNAALGVLTAMQHELYRRMIAPYEDTKIRDNGDVFPSWIAEM